MMDLPHFNPDDDRSDGTAAGSIALAPVVGALRAEIAAVHAVLFSTPEYAGALPGCFKNLLDWTVGSADLYEKPTAYLNVAAPGRGDGAVATLIAVLGYVGARVEPDACVRLPVSSDNVGPDGLITNAEFRSGAVDALIRLAAFATNKG